MKQSVTYFQKNAVGRRITVLFVLLLFLVAPAAGQNYDFSAVAPSGQTLYFDDDREQYNNLTHHYEYEGVWIVGYQDTLGQSELIIPSTVEHEGSVLNVVGIDDYAFHYYSEINSLIIPTSLKYFGNDVFGGCSNLSSIIVSEGNTVFDSRNNCNAIIETATNTLVYGCKNTIIPSTVTSIGNNAFYHHDGLTSIILPEGITSIGFSAFDVTGLTEITIPNGVTSIGVQAFANCNISSLTIPNTVSYIGYGAFRSWSISSVVIPSSVTNIESGAFIGCANLTSIIVDSANPVYDSRDNCNAIIETATNTLTDGCRNTVIPNGIIAIAGAFTGGRSPESLIIPSTVTQIDGYAFAYSGYYTNNNILTELTLLPTTPPSYSADSYYKIPNNVSILVPCEAIESYQNSNDWREYTNIHGFDCPTHNVVAVPNIETMGSVSGGGDIAKYETATLTATPNCGYQFVGWTANGNTISTSNPLTFNVISDTSLVAEFEAATAISVNHTCTTGQTLTYSLDNCSSTATITGHVGEVTGTLTIPESITVDNNNYTVTAIGDSAFVDCLGMTRVDIPGSVTRFGADAFKNDSALTSVHYESTWRSWAQKDFANLEANPIYWGHSLYVNGDSKFRSIESYIFEGLVINKYAFAGCDVTRLVLGGVSYIGDYAFYKCDSLDVFATSDGSNSEPPLDSIGEHAFEDCSMLRVLRIGGSCKKIGYWYVNGCPNVKISFTGSISQWCRIKFGGGYGDVPIELSLIPSNGILVIPDDVDTINDFAFCNFKNLREVVIPASTRVIRYYNFYKCPNLNKVTFNGPTDFYVYSFDRLQNLREIVFLCETPPNATPGKCVAQHYSRIYDLPYDTTLHLDSIILRIPCGAFNTYYNSSWGQEYDSAQFVEPEPAYSITVASESDAIGSAEITRAPTCSNMSATIQATAECAHRFVQWSDGNNNNPRTLTLSSDTILTAQFERTKYAVITPSGHTLYYVLQGNHAELICPYGLWENDNADWNNYYAMTGSVSLPSSVTHGGNTYPITTLAVDSCSGGMWWGTFDNCPGITAINIPEGVTIIGPYAFSQCGIATVTIPSTVSTIGIGAFKRCENMTSIDVLATIPPVLGNDVFNNVPTNIPVHVPCGSLAAYQSAVGWSNFTNIQEINCPQTVTVVANDDSYGAVTGGGTVTSGETATLTATPNCGYRFVCWTANGDTISMENPLTFTVTTDSAFTAVFDQTKYAVVAPSGQTLYYTIDCSNNSASLVPPSNNSWDGFVKPAGVLTIPTTVIVEGNQYTVTAIESSALSNCVGLTSVTIPNTVNSIGIHSFHGCTNLSSVAIPSSVTDIYGWAFINCSSLTSIIIPESVTWIGNTAFSGCTSLETIQSLAQTPPRMYTGLYPFYGLSNDILVLVPCGSLSAYQAAEGWGQAHNCDSWCGFTNIQEFGCPQTVTVVANDDSYGTVTGGGTVASGETATLFATPNCGYKFVRWTNSNNEEISTENEYTFIVANDTTITAVFTYDTISRPCAAGQILKYIIDCSNNTATIVGHGNCTGNLGIPSTINYDGIIYTVSKIGMGAFYHCTGLTSVSIPNSVTIIGGMAFQNCYDLISVTIPNSVTKIDDWSFCYCTSLSSIVIPNSVANIGVFAFDGCTTLSSVTTLATTPPVLGGSVFFNTAASLIVHVPCGSLTAYQAAEEWNTLNLSDDSPVVTVASSNNTMGTAEVTTAPTCADGSTTVTASPAEHYRFTGWSVNGQTVSTANPYNFTTDSDISLTANFELIQYTVTTQVNNASYGTAMGGGTYSEGSTATLTASPAEHYHFTGWSVNGQTVSTTNPYSFTVTTDITLTAQFAVTEYTVVVTPSDPEMGSVTGGGTVTEGETITVTAMPQPCYRFVQWSDGDTNNPRTLIVTAATSLTAQFELIPSPTVTATSANNAWGTAEVTENPSCGSNSATVTATEAQGYAFVAWMENCNLVANTATYSFTTSTDRSLTALFVEKVHDTTYIDVPYAVHDTTYIDVHDTTYVPVHDTTYIDVPYAVHDTTYIDVPYAVHDTTVIHDTMIAYLVHIGDTALVTRYVYDSTLVNHTYHDTFYVYTRDVDTLHIFDTMMVNLYQFDTTIVNVYQYDTTLIHIYDTTIVNNYQYDTSIYNHFRYDTTLVYDTMIVNVYTYDTSIYNNYRYDTVVLNTYQYDTTIVNVYDTTLINIYDTTIVNNYQYDTSIYNHFRYDTTLVYDTMIVNVYTYDTSIYNNYRYDTVVLNTYQYDTTLVNVYQYDTTIVNIYDTTINNHYQYDTVIVNNYVYDTVIVNHYFYDTTIVNNHDTVNNYFFDTVIITHYYHDTVLVNNYIFDTIYLNRYIFDTVWLHDTVVVHDTVYITQEGIDGADPLNAKVYASQGQIVVEGADGNTVTLYDVNGRILATRRDEFMPLYFDGLASGTYMVKIGRYPARKVVVIR